MRRAEITVFLSMVLILIVSFILGIIGTVVIQTSKNRSRLETDSAIFSIFGEYQKDLLEEYHIFAIEGTYKTGEFKEDRIIGRMHYYGVGDTDHEITEIQFLTDNHGQAFREQVTAYMESCYGVGLIRDFTGLTDKWEQQCIEGESIQNEEETLTQRFEELKEAAAAVSDTQEEGQEKAEEAETGNPFSCLEQIEKSGLLSVVMPDDMTLSGKTVDKKEQVSERLIHTGRGSFPARTGLDGIEERLLFNEYILQSFTNASDNKEPDNENPRSLSYETEYILSGKPSDKENLESVLLKIFLIRTALNYAYLTGDMGKQAEAEALAAAISILLLIPEGMEVVKQLVLFAWAAGESTVDLRTLLSGNKVPLIKTKENWQVSLPELLTLGEGFAKTGDEDAQGGISYKDYLRIFLFMADQQDTTMRSLDRIEENLKSEYGMGYFRADHCVSKIKLKNTAVILGDITYTYPVYFGYE